MGVLYFISDVLFVLIYYLIGYRKKVVRQNLELVFPDKAEKEIKDITRRFYHHLCDMVVESVKSLSISEKELNKRFTFTNVEEIHKLEKQGKSIVLMGGHYGSWEWSFILQRHINHKGYAVYKKIENKYFDALIKGLRAKYNTHLITTKETYHKLGASQMKGELTINGFLADQTAKHWKTKHWQEFLGVKVPVLTGAEMIAKRLNMAVVFIGTKKIKRGHYSTTFKTIATEAKELPDFEITDTFLKLVEELIYEDPAYYLWTHKRWKYKDNAPKEIS
ncbi:MAG: lipid A biosynthesis protein [Aureisphaera sp.]